MFGFLVSWFLSYHPSLRAPFKNVHQSLQVLASVGLPAAALLHLHSLPLPDGEMILRYGFWAARPWMDPFAAMKTFPVL